MPNYNMNYAQELLIMIGYPVRNLPAAEAINILEQLMACLSDREADIIRHRFGQDRLTLEQLGKKHGLSRERVRCIQAEAEEKIKKAYNKTIILKKLKENVDPDLLKQIPVSQLDLPNRCRMVFRRHGVKTLYDVTQLTREKLLTYRCLGQKSIEGLEEVLKEYKITFKDNEVSS